MKRFIHRLWRANELIWLLLAVLVSVAALSSVAFLADRMQLAFERDAKQLIGADLLVQSDQPLPRYFLDEAQKSGLTTAQTTVFPTMATHREQSKLVALKAVTPSYPLRGQLLLGDTPTGHSRVATGAPGIDEAWIDPALMPSLQIKLGDTLQLGYARFRVTAYIHQELDRGAGFLNFAPRVMIHADALAATGLIGFGSRVTYRLLLAGDAQVLKTYQAWVDQTISQKDLRGIKVEGIDNSQPLMRSTLDRAEKFLSLVALLTAMVAAVAIALAARRYVNRQAQASAIWKCLGATRMEILLDHIRVTATLACLGGVLGAGLGWLGHQVLLWFLQDLLVAQLPASSLWPFVWAVLVAMVLLLGFVWPPLFALTKISPLMVLRKEISYRAVSAWLVLLLGLAAFALLLLVVAQSPQLALYTLGGFAAAAILFWVFAWLLVRGLSFLAQQAFLAQGVIQRFVWQAMSRRAAFTSLQIASLAIALMALLLLSVVRHDLLSAWQTSQASYAPNRFLINIQPDQAPQVEKYLRNVGIEEVTLYPMIRGRLVQINGKTVTPDDFDEGRAQRLVDREFNLSYGTDIPEGNRIVAGRWHQLARDELSIEEGIAKTLGLNLGDQLTFDMAGLSVNAKITSIRKLDWTSMRVNFFAILSPSTLQDMPQTWITAYRQNQEQIGHLPADIALVAKFPNITVVDVDASLKQVQDVLDKLSAAIELLFSLTIAAGILVLGAALASTQDERMRDAGLLKALGASSAQVRKAFYTELILIGMVSGLLAAIAASVVGSLLAQRVFEMPLQASLNLYIYGIVAGTIASVIGGLWLDGKVSRSSALQVLRDAT